MSSAVKIAPASLFLVESPIDRCQEVKSRIPLLVVIVESGCALKVVDLLSAAPLGQIRLLPGRCTHREKFNAPILHLILLGF